MRAFSITFLVNILVCCLFCGTIAKSQIKSSEDSLASIYISKKTNIDKLNMLNSLGGRTSNTVYQLFIEKKLADLKTKLKPPSDSAFYYLALGNLYYSKSDILTAKIYLRKSLQLLETSNDYNEITGDLSSQIAHLFLYEGKRDSSYYYYNKAVTIYKKNKIYKSLSQAYYELGLECYATSKVSLAIENLFKSIKVGIIQKKYADVSVSYRLLSKISRDQNTSSKYNYIDSAIYYAEKSEDNYTMVYSYFLNGEYHIDEKKFDEGYAIAKKIETIYKKDTLNHWIKSDYNEYFARYYQAKGDYSNCIKFYKKTIDINIANNYFGGKIGWMYNNMGDVCITNDRHEEAIVYFDSAIVYSERFQDLNLKWYAYYNIISAYQGLKDYKTALNYFWKYDSINNIILTKENGSKIAELQTKYDVERKENQIKLLNKDNELNKENIEKQHQRILFLSIIIGVTLLLILIVIVAYRTKRKANILLSKQKQEIIDKTEQLNKQAADIAMYKAQMNPHFLFNAINSVQLFVLEKQSHLALEYLSDLSKLMRSTLNFSDKEFISIKDEIDYLNQYIRFEKLRCDNKFEFHVTISDKIDAENTCVLPMLIQPFIENAVKHGVIPKTEKGSIVVGFEKITILTNEFLKITIDDDGVGRVAAQTNKQQLVAVHQSKGMEITENRILKLNEKHFSEAIQGIKIIDKFVDDKSVGTTIELYIPFIELF